LRTDQHCLKSLITDHFGNHQNYPAHLEAVHLNFENFQAYPLRYKHPDPNNCQIANPSNRDLTSKSIVCQGDYVVMATLLLTTKKTKQANLRELEMVFARETSACQGRSESNHLKARKPQAQDEMCTGGVRRLLIYR
jgi:hypothetical protein